MLRAVFAGFAVSILIVVASAVGQEEKPAPPKKPRVVRISGQVLDAETGQPITGFVIQGGRFDPQDPKKPHTWGYSESRRTSKTGRFSTSVRWELGWTSRIVADGYYPQPVITDAPPEDKDRLVVNVRLRPGRLVKGRVLDHKKQPVAGASVFAVGPTGVKLAGGRALKSHNEEEDTTAYKAVTDEGGRFQLRVGDVERLAVSSATLDAWAAPLPNDKTRVEIELPEPARLVLWYDIDGAEDEAKFFWQLLSHQMKGFERVRVERYAKVKRRETLVLPAMTPGDYQLVRSRMLHTRSMGFGRMLDRQWITLKPGERKVVRFLRPDGHRIQGKVQGLAKAKLTEAMVSVQPDPEPPNPGGKFKGWLTLDARLTDADGNFTTERLPPGKYLIKVEGYLPLTPEQQTFSGIVGPSFTAQTRVTVPVKGPPPKVELKLGK